MHRFPSRNRSSIASSHGGAGEHVYEDLDPAKTALVVVDMQNAFMLPGVAHALCPMAEKIVPNINRLAQAVRDTGGAVIWIKTTFTRRALQELVDLFRDGDAGTGARSASRRLPPTARATSCGPASMCGPDDTDRREEPLQRFHPGLVRPSPTCCAHAGSTRC